MEWLADPQAWLSLLTLTFLEIVLGVDNIIFISILVRRLPSQQRDLARRVGLALAMGMRIALLLSLAWLTRLTDPLFSVLDHPVSVRDLILIVGGLFLLAKSTLEIHQQLEGDEDHHGGAVAATFKSVIVQIAVLDIVFSLDSVITAIGLAYHVEIMIIAIVVAVLVMMAAAKSLGAFLEQHPTLQMLALSFLLLIGLALVADGIGVHIPKGYIYFAMGFSVGVEILNTRLRRRRRAPVRLHKQYAERSEGSASGPGRPT